MTRFAFGSLVHAFCVRREEGMMRGVMGDLAFTVRALLRRPAFLLLSVSTLAVGIGAATTVFSVAEAVLLRDPPLPEAHRLVSVYSTNPTVGMDGFSVSYPDYLDWTGRADLFESASMYGTFERDLSGEGDPERLLTAGVHNGFFETLGSAAALGRLLTDEDQNPRAERTVVLSHELWVRRFGRSPEVLGHTLRFDAVPHTVVGVASAGQGWPTGVEAWTPLQYGSTPPESVNRRGNHRWQVVARMLPSVTAGAASDQLRAIASAWYTSNAAGDERGIEALAVPLRSAGSGREAFVGFAVMGTAVLLVLLIACINQANLLLVNAWSRARELSLRAALGAGRSRLISLLLGESALLALAGAMGGLALAWFGLQAIETMIPAGATQGLDAGLNGFVVAVAAGIALLASLLAGITPALRASRMSMSGALSEGGSATGAGRSGARMRRGLVVVEMTLSVVLLTGAGLAIRTFQGQLEAESGFDSERVVVFNVRLPQARYPDMAASNQFFDEAVRRLEASPGIESASAASNVPLGVSHYNTYRAFLLEGAPEPPAGPDFGALWIEVDPGYFETLGAQPVRGRAVSPDDGPGSTPVMILNESMARRMSPEQEIIGRRVRSWRDEDVLRDVVGVVPDMQLSGMAGQVQPAVFVPRSQGQYTTLSFILRSVGDPAGIVSAVRAIMKELDGDVALQGLQTLQEAHREELAGVRIVTMLFGVFGALALVLAVSGVYGLVATSVAQRTREIGIRMALGGTKNSVRGQVLGESARLAVYGIGGGLILAMAFAKILAGLIVGLSWLDPSTLLSVTALLTSAVLLASWIPAVRATRVDPVRALKTE
jgi:predicted permease